MPRSSTKFISVIDDIPTKTFILYFCNDCVYKIASLTLIAVWDCMTAFKQSSPSIDH